MHCQIPNKLLTTLLPSAMKHFLSSVILAVLLLPGTAHAYVEPEDVLFGNDDVLSEEEEMHNAASAKSSMPRRTGTAVSSKETLRPAAPDQNSGLSPSEQSLLDRLNRQAEEAPPVYVPQNFTPGQAQEETLHSGAPAMSHTGPETAIALTILVLTIGGTVFAARSGYIDLPKK